MLELSPDQVTPLPPPGQGARKEIGHKPTVLTASCCKPCPVPRPRIPMLELSAPMGGQVLGKASAGGCGKGGGPSRAYVGWAVGNLSTVPCGNPAQPSQASVGLRVDLLLEGSLLANTSLSHLSLENHVSG